LEFELAHKTTAVSKLEALMAHIQDQHERELDDLTAKFKKLDNGYRMDAIETQK